MRNPENISRRTPPRRKKKSNGCGCGCFLLFVLFLIAIVFGVKFVASNGTSITEKIRKTQYPVKYEHFVDKYAKKQNLSPGLVYGIIRTESSFDVYAVSSADAKGLMQLTDETALDCAKKLNIKGFKTDMLFDPETNIRLGCFYLRQLMDKYDYIENALAAYNGGPGNADEWLKNPEYTDGNGKLVNIPFQETQNYVKRVLNAQQMYKEIYSMK